MDTTQEKQQQQRLPTAQLQDVQTSQPSQQSNRSSTAVQSTSTISSNSENSSERLSSATATAPANMLRKGCDEDLESSVGTASDTSSLASYNSKTGMLRQLHRRMKQKAGLIKDLVLRQNFYAHCLKLLTLFVIALVHFFYIRPFLDTLSLLENYSAKVDSKFSGDLSTANSATQQQTQFAIHSEQMKIARMALRHEVDVLIDYKKNVWMTVAAMCMALSTSCFFLFIMPITRTVRRFHVFLIGAIDLVSFASMPILLLARAELVGRVTDGLPEALRVAHRLVSAECLMNSLQCTIHPREKLAFCSDVLVESIFPVALLKYLVILCVLTLAYILLAYLIDYCIRHWFPPHSQHLQYHSPNCVIGSNTYCNINDVFGGGSKKHNNQCYPECDCCLNNYNKQKTSTNVYDCCWSGTCTYCSYKNAKREFKNKTYLPALLMPMTNSTKENVGSDFVFGVRPQIPTLLPNPLIGQLSPVSPKETTSQQPKQQQQPQQPQQQSNSDESVTEESLATNNNNNLALLFANSSTSLESIPAEPQPSDPK